MDLVHTTDSINNDTSTESDMNNTTMDLSLGASIEFDETQPMETLPDEWNNDNVSIRGADGKRHANTKTPRPNPEKTNEENTANTHDANKPNGSNKPKAHVRVEETPAVASSKNEQLVSGHGTRNEHARDPGHSPASLIGTEGGGDNEQPWNGSPSTSAQKNLPRYVLHTIVKESDIPGADT